MSVAGEQNADVSNEILSQGREQKQGGTNKTFTFPSGEIVTAPKPPILKLLANDGITAQVGWEVEQSEEVKSYTVLVAAKGKETQKLAHAMQTILDDMEPGCLYGVSVCAETGGEHGPYTQLLTFPSAPLPPSDVDVVPNQMAPENSVILKFNDPDPRDKDYVVIVVDLRDTSSDFKREITKQTTLCIGDLRPDSLYKVCVQARIECPRSGEKLMSSKAFYQQEIQTFPEQPDGLKMEEISGQSFKISWGSTAGANKYEVKWKICNATNFVERETVDNYLVLQDLCQGSRYEVTVAAVNKAGIGKRSASLYFLTAPCPPAELKVENYESSPDTTLVVSVVDPKPDNKRYRFVAQPLSTDKDVVVETERLVILLKNLIPGEKYKVYAVIIDKTTKKESEKTYHNGLAQTRPAEVTGLEAEISQDTCLQLSWDPLELTPLRYQIGMNINGRDMPSEYTDKTSFTLSNLTPSTTYRVMVGAVNAAGCGKFCQPKECRTRPAGPLKIIGKRCATNPSSALSIWVEDNDSIRKQYRVEARDAKNDVARSVTTWEKHAVLCDLNSGTSYRINVVAIDGELESEPVWLCQP